MAETEVGRAIETAVPRRGTILVRVVQLLEHMTSDWDLDLVEAIGPESHLVRDLGFSSTDVWFLGGKLQQEFNQWDLPFADLHVFEGDRVRDLRVSELVDFLQSNLHAENVP